MFRSAVVLMECLLSLSVSHSLCLCLSAFHSFLSFRSFSLSMCGCDVFLSLPGRRGLHSDSRLHSQAKHQNTQHWWVTLSCQKWTGTSSSVFGFCKAWFVHQSLWKNNPNQVFFKSVVRERKSISRNWLIGKTSIFCSYDAHRAMWARRCTQQLMDSTVLSCTCFFIYTL